MEEQLAIQTAESFDRARRIYDLGGHSESYARIMLTSSLIRDVPKGTKFLGKNDAGEEVAGSSYEDYETGTEVIRVYYETSEFCQVGGLPEVEVNLEGCFASNNVIEIGETVIDENEIFIGTSYVPYDYSYEPISDNRNGRTLAGFSASALDTMFTSCAGCPHYDYYDYYGIVSYANDFINSAFEGTATNFNNGNEDFSRFGFVGRGEFIKKATVLMNVFMYVIRQLVNASVFCERAILEAAIDSWDEGACFYVGSLNNANMEGALDGKLLYELADKRCANFKTCGPDGDQLDGSSKVNLDLMELIALGKINLQNGVCSAVRDIVDQITRLMYVPLNW